MFEMKSEIKVSVVWNFKIEEDEEGILTIDIKNNIGFEGWHILRWFISMLKELEMKKEMKLDDAEYKLDDFSNLFINGMKIGDYDLFKAYLKREIKRFLKKKYKEIFEFIEGEE